MTDYSAELSGGEVGRNQLVMRQAARTHSMKAINTCLLFLSILGGLVGLGYLFFDPIVKHVILNKLVLTNSSDFAKIWEEPPITPHLKVYFFNLTNAQQVFEGKEKPNLKEVGPYTYHQKWIKENVLWHSNGTMSYSTRKEYSFVPELSVGDHSLDKLTTLNVPVISAYYQKRDADYWTRLMLEQLILSYENEMWVTKTAEELIWGYDEPLFELAKMFLPNPPTYQKFGFFTDKNSTASLPTYTMFTGEGDPYKLSRISLFNGNEHLTFWKEDQCNRVQGSDGATFNPYIRKEDTLWFFNDQLCRSMPLVFQEDVVSRTLPGLRFVPRNDVFMSTISHPENECFCVDQDLCSMLGDGMFGVSACQFDAPIVLSWPHFLGANQSYVNAINGMKPVAEKHAFWFDIQPITGTTLSAKARIQINLAVKHNDGFEGLSKIPDTVFPMLWFEEGLDELGQDLVDVISGAVHDPPQYKNYLFCLLLGLMTSTTVIAIVALVRLCLNKRRRKLAKEFVAKEILEVERMCKCQGFTSAESASILQPMLLDSGVVSSAESSRMTTANHSRNTSTGSNQVVQVHQDHVQMASERLQLIIDGKSRSNRLPTV